MNKKHLNLALKGIIGLVFLCILVFNIILPSGKTSGLKEFSLSTLKASARTNTESECESDCAWEAQAQFGYANQVLTERLTECLDDVQNTVILAWTGTVTPWHAASNFPAVWDIFSDAYPNAMDCIGDADEIFGDNLDEAAQDWDDCTEGCQ